MHMLDTATNTVPAIGIPDPLDCAFGGLGGCVGSAITGKGVSDVPGAVAGSAGNAIGGSIISQTAEKLSEAADWAISNLITVWLKVGSVEEVSGANPDASVRMKQDGAVTWLHQHLLYWAGLALVISFLFTAARLMLSQKSEDLHDLGETMFRFVLVTFGGAWFVTMLLAVGDNYSNWILDQAGDGEVFKPLMAGMVAGFPSFLVIFLGVIVLLTQIIQLIIMTIRNVMIILLLGALPVIAASGGTAAGKDWWKKAAAWMLAFILYKPVAATIYAMSFKLTQGDGVEAKFMGITLMCLAVVGLPALMRFLVPMTSQVASGNAGMMATGMVVAAGTAAAGAAAGGLGGAGGASAAGGGGGFGSMAGASSSGGASPPAGSPAPTGGGTGGGGGGTGGGATQSAVGVVESDAASPAPAPSQPMMKTSDSGSGGGGSSSAVGRTAQAFDAGMNSYRAAQSAGQSEEIIDGGQK